MLPNLTVTAVAKSRTLCLKAEVESELGITAGSEDLKLNGLIRAAGSFIATELGREPWLQTYLEKRPGQGGRYLYLSRFPLKGDPASVTFGTGDSPETITASTYSTAGRDRDRIYRADGWSLTSVGEAEQVHSSQALAYNVTYSAGWVMPDQYKAAAGTVTAWVANTAYAVGDWLADDADLDFPLIFECTTAGTSDASTEPTWSGADSDGDAITDGTVVWTAREQQLPDDLELAAKMLVVDWYSGFPSAGVQYEALESWSIRYTENQRALSQAVAALVAAHR